MVEIDKHIYDASEIVYSDDWCIADYRTAEKQRLIDRNERFNSKLHGVAAVKAIIEDECICSFSYLVKYIDSHFPELSGIVLEKAPYFGRIVDSKRYDVSCGFSDMSYKDVCKMLEHERSVNNDLDNRLEECHKAMAKRVEEYVRLKHRYDELQAQYSQLSALLYDKSEDLGFIEL